MKKNKEATGFFFLFRLLYRPCPQAQTLAGRSAASSEEPKVTPFKSSGGRKLGEGCPGVTFLFA